MANMATPQQVAAKWASRLAGAGDQIKQGVQAVSVSPTAKAAQRVDAYQAGVQRAVANGKFVASLNAVSLEDWRKAFIDKGIPRIAQGTQTGQPKMARFMTAWLPVMQAASAQVATMPKGTTEDAVNRVRVIIQAGKSFRDQNR